MFTSVVIAVLISLSAVLTASVVFPGITGRQIILITGGCMTAAVAVGGWTLLRSLRVRSSVEIDRHDRENWRIKKFETRLETAYSDLDFALGLRFKSKDGTKRELYLWEILSPTAAL